MDLKTILTFQKIVDLGTFQRASQELNYAQSTITTHIKNLEEELGVILIERGRNLTLTEAGKVFYEKGKLLLKGYEQLKNAMDDVIDNASIIRIGVMEPFASFRLPEILQQFKKLYPNAQITISIESNRRLLQLVQEGEIDVAICAASEVPKEFTFTPMFQEDVVLLASTSHPLANELSVEIAQLEHFQLLTTSSHCPFRHNFEHEAMKQNFFPKYVMEISNMLALKHYVMCKEDIAVVPAITVVQPPIHTVVIPLEGFEKGITIGLLERTHKASDNRIVEAFTEILLSHYYQTI